MPRAIALAANGFQIGNARQPLAPTLPLKSMGDSARPAGSSRTKLYQVAHAENGSTSLHGPKRRFAAMQHFGCFRSKADMNRQAKRAGSVENDPQRISSLYLCWWRVLNRACGRIEVSPGLRERPPTEAKGPRNGGPSYAYITLENRLRPGSSSAGRGGLVAPGV
jgi:hypothetical protein